MGEPQLQGLPKWPFSPLWGFRARNRSLAKQRWKACSSQSKEGIYKSLALARPAQSPIAVLTGGSRFLGSGFPTVWDRVEVMPLAVNSAPPVRGKVEMGNFSLPLSSSLCY